FRMFLPPQYASWLERLGFEEISFGYSGIKLFSPAELDERQIGYSRGADGQSFCDGRPGRWQPEWLVSGYETTCGDPICLDTSCESLPVLTAMHGQGVWDPDLVAVSLQAFGQTLQLVCEIGIGREYPVALEENPLPEQELGRVLRRIGQLNGGEIGMDFWSIFLRAPE